MEIFHCKGIAMKNIILLLISLFFIINVISMEDTAIYFDDLDNSVTMVPPKLHELYELDGNMSIKLVAETIDIPLESFKSYFRLNLRDPRIDESSLNNQDINLDAVYQFYSLERYGFNDFSTINEVSEVLSIPYKKLTEYLHLNPQISANRTRTIRETGRETIDMLQYHERFKQESLNYSSTLTVLGMAVVLIALLLVSVVVSHLNIFESKKPEKVNVVAPSEKSTKAAQDFINFEDAVVAIAATIHRFKSELATDHKILLTYRRIDVSMWQASGKTEMPNKHFDLIRRSR